MSKPGLYGDGDGLYLQVAAGGTKAWILRYMRAGRARKRPSRTYLLPSEVIENGHFTPASPAYHVDNNLHNR